MRLLLSAVLFFAAFFSFVAKDAYSCSYCQGQKVRKSVSRAYLMTALGLGALPIVFGGVLLGVLRKDRPEGDEDSSGGE